MDSPTEISDLNPLASNIAESAKQFAAQISQSAAAIAHAIGELKHAQPKLTVDVDDEAVVAWHNTVNSVETSFSALLEQVDRVVLTGERSMADMIDGWEYSVSSVKSVIGDGYLTAKYIGYVMVLISALVCLYKSVDKHPRNRMLVIGFCLAVPVIGIVIMPKASEHSVPPAQRFNGLPVGTIVLFPKNATVPTGWLKCDGSTIPPVYRELTAVLGDTLPSLNGDTTDGVPAGNALGSFAHHIIKGA